MVALFWREVSAMVGVVLSQRTKWCLRLGENRQGIMFRGRGYGICCLEGIPKLDIWDGMENSKRKLQNIGYLSTKGSYLDFYKVFREQCQFIKIEPGPYTTRFISFVCLWLLGPTFENIFKTWICCIPPFSLPARGNQVFKFCFK